MTVQEIQWVIFGVTLETGFLTCHGFGPGHGTESGLCSWGGRCARRATNGSETLTLTWCTTLTCDRVPDGRESATSCCLGRRGGCGHKTTVTGHLAAGPSSLLEFCGHPVQTRSRSPGRRTGLCPGRTWHLLRP